MTSLLKGLQEKHEEPPMAPAMARSAILEYVSPLNQASIASSTNLRQQPDRDERASQLLAAMEEDIDLSTLTRKPMTPLSVEHGVTGLPLKIIMLGAVISAVPGAEITSNICDAAALTAAKARSTFRMASQLAKSFKGVDVDKSGRKENMNDGWVEVTKEDVGLGCTGVEDDRDYKSSPTSSIIYPDQFTTVS